MGNYCKYEIWCDIVAMDVSHFLLWCSLGDMMGMLSMMAIEIYIPLKLEKFEFVLLPIKKERAPKSFKEQGSYFLISPNCNIR